MSPSCCANRPALTLLELVVVLGILAVLSSVAIRSLEPIADQARYERTQAVLDDIKSAIVGNYEQRLLPAQPISGLTLDTGVLPAGLEDLLVRPSGLIDRTLQTFDSDRDSTDDISLTSGWNGPYLSLTAGLTEIVDGWGRDLSLAASSGEIEVLSLGSDGNSTAPEDGYERDLTVTINTDEYLGTVVFRLFAIDSNIGSRIDPSPSGSQQLGVLFYGVNSTGGVSGAIAEQLIVINNSGSFEFRRDNTLVGTTAARAILWDDTNNDDALDSGETIVQKSIVVYPVVQPRIDTRVEMELR